VKYEDQTEGNEKELSCPAPSPKDQDRQEHEYPRQRRQDEVFEELLKNKHEERLFPETGRSEFAREAQGWKYE
jgi:hypothetical protein